MSSVRLVNMPGGRLSARVAKQVPFATALALTRTAQDIEAEGKRLMRSKLVRLREFTLRAQAVRPATKTDLEAETFFREFAGKGVAAGKYLAPLEFGGPRRAKRHELRLRAVGILQPGEFTAPVAGGPFDHNRAGLGGQYTRLLSALQASSDGFQNRTKASTARASRRGRKPSTFFRAGNAIWQRQGKKARPVLNVIRQPSYRAKLSFAATAERVARDRLPRQMELALRQALATAR